MNEPRIRDTNWFENGKCPDDWPILVVSRESEWGKRDPQWSEEFRWCRNNLMFGTWGIVRQMSISNRSQTVFGFKNQKDAFKFQLLFEIVPQSEWWADHRRCAHLGSLEANRVDYVEKWGSLAR